MMVHACGVHGPAYLAPASRARVAHFSLMLMGLTVKIADVIELSSVHVLTWGPAAARAPATTGVSREL